MAQALAGLQRGEDSGAGIDFRGRSLAPASLWSLCAALREQEKPVDLQYIPTGEHNFMMPLHQLAHQEAVVDWFDLWLNTHEDASPGKAEQYERWRRLRETRKAAEH
jgi:hypothetical protein